MSVDQAFGKHLQRLIKAVGEQGLAKRLEWLQPSPIGVRLKALTTIQRRKWPDLVRFAAALRKEAQHDLDAMTSQQRDWSALWRDTQRLRDEAERRWPRPDTHPEWSSWHDRLVSDVVAKGFSAEQVEAGLVRYAHATAHDMMKMAEEPIVWFGRQLDACLPSRLSSLAAADLADAVAQFNIEYEAPPNPVREPEPDVARDWERTATRALREIQTALRTGDLGAARSRAMSAESEADQLVAPLLRAAAYHASHPPSSHDAADGRRALRIADAIRAVLFAKSAARAVVWRTGWAEGSPLVAGWLAAATNLSFESAFRTPPVTSLADLARIPADFDATELSIEGHVGPITIVHRGAKAISSTTLTEKSGASVQVGIPYIKIDSGGMVPGAYARLDGRFMVRHDDFTGPVLVLDRRNLAEGARTSWLDWLAHELSAVITPIAHNFAATWSWIAGADGAGNPLQYGTWSANIRQRAV